MSIKIFKDSKYPTSIIHLKGNTELNECATNRSNDVELNPLFVWIPGNPGLLEYYQEFLESVHLKHPEWDILGISHAGMSNDNPNLNENECTVYTLNEQIQHKVDVINKFSCIDRELIVMGHSVGAFMAQKAIMSAGIVGNVKKLGLLMPTVIDINLSEKGLKISSALKWINNLPSLAGWISKKLFQDFLPINMVKFVISSFMGLHKDNKAVNSTYIFLKNSHFVEQSLGLARYEMKMIRHDWDFQRRLVQLCNHKKIQLWTLFAESDHWVSDHTRSELIELYRNHIESDFFSYNISEKVPHAFVVKDTHYVVEKYF